MITVNSYKNVFRLHLLHLCKRSCKLTRQWKQIWNRGQKDKTTELSSKDSSPCSQEPTTGPYHKLDESSPHHHTLFILRSILILSSHLRLDLPSRLFPWGFQTNSSICHLSHVCYISCPPHIIWTKWLNKRPQIKWNYLWPWLQCPEYICGQN